MRSLYQPSSQGIYAPGGAGAGGGVTSIIAGAGISVDQATGAVTITNTGIAGSATVSSFTNNSGNTTITPTSASEIVVGVFGGTARTSIAILDVAGRSDGDRMSIRFQQPSVANVVEEIRNATAGGTLLYSYTTDGSGVDTITFEVYFEAGEWHPLLNVQPVI